MKPIKDDANREAMWIVGAWCLFALWMLTASYWLPPTTSEAPRMILGMPMWIVLGVALPWLIATALTIWFALCVMTDDPPAERNDD